MDAAHNSNGTNRHAFVVSGLNYNESFVGLMNTYIYLHSGEGGANDDWYHDYLWGEGLEGYTYRYDCKVLTGIRPNPSKLGSTADYRYGLIWGQSYDFRVLGYNY